MLSRTMAVLLTLIFLTVGSVFASDKTVYDFKTQTLAGKDVKLSKYEGKVLLIVNVASKCGNTPQYKGLEELYKKI